MRSASTIGQLERMAGIGPDHDERFAIWIQYKDLETRHVIPTGVAELKKRIRAFHGLA
jgi:hypothetical protein